MRWGTETKLKFKMLKLRLSLREWEAEGLLSAIWRFAAVNAPAGDVGRHTNEEIAIGIDYDLETVDRLVEVLVELRWLDEHPEHRLVVHDWPEHCENGVHKHLARRGQKFWDGSIPKLGLLDRGEREEARRRFAQPEGAAEEQEPPEGRADPEDREDPGDRQVPKDSTEPEGAPPTGPGGGSIHPESSACRDGPSPNGRSAGGTPAELRRNSGGAPAELRRNSGGTPAERRRNRSSKPSHTPKPKGASQRQAEAEAEGEALVSSAQKSFWSSRPAAESGGNQARAGPCARAGDPRKLEMRPIKDDGGQDESGEDPPRERRGPRPGSVRRVLDQEWLSRREPLVRKICSVIGARTVLDAELALKALALSEHPMSEAWLWDALEGVRRKGARLRRRAAYFHRCLAEACQQAGHDFNQLLARLAMAPELRRRLRGPPAAGARRAV